MGSGGASPEPEGRSAEFRGPQHAAGALTPAGERELHAARARAIELEHRVAELGAQLIAAEQRTAELLRVRAQLAQSDRERSEAMRELAGLREGLGRRPRAGSGPPARLRGLRASLGRRVRTPLRAARRRVRTLLDP